MDIPSEWREGLQEGSELDAVKGEKTSNIYGWARGVVEGERVGDMITVHFENESDFCSQYIHSFIQYIYIYRNFLISSEEIAPLGRRTEDTKWRAGLKKGDKVDCLDTTNTWYKSTILDARETIHGKEIYVAYRVYTPDGAKTDEKGDKFNGWSATYDEWINSYSNRLQKYIYIYIYIYIGGDAYLRKGHTCASER